MDVFYNAGFLNCPNATWNGHYASFCTGYATHDVTVHEWGHAYSEATHGLLYRWQSGALNESYADIWGESLDINQTLPMVPAENDNAPLRAVGDCPAPATSVRWRQGENLPNGALRDLWNPNCFDDPGKVSDTQYHCFASDGGGVHTNSGVPNHAYSLLVDGGCSLFQFES